jgi:hypothetical protein
MKHSEAELRGRLADDSGDQFSPFLGLDEPIHRAWSTGAIGSHIGSRPQAPPGFSFWLEAEVSSEAELWIGVMRISQVVWLQESHR